jgi:hypothetical protein
MKPQSQKTWQQEFDALNDEMAELERSIAAAKERLIVNGRRVRRLLYLRAPTPTAADDEATVEAIAQQKLTAQDPGEPDQGGAA